jgi:hypothetical protein
MTRAHKTYALTLLALFAAALLPILVLNLALSNRSYGNIGQEVLRASDWQQRTHGITYAPSLSNTELFKTLRLKDRLPEINTVIFGSSTVLGITQNMLPAPMHAYNFSQTGHSLTASIGEAEWVMAHTDNIRYLVIPLDWSIGFIYQSGGPAAADLSADAIRRRIENSHNNVPLLDRIRDALSYPRIKSLSRIAEHIALADDRFSAFRQYFLQDSSDDYRCADGTPAKDFDTFHRGTCTGFRFDGSATFANTEPVTDPQQLILSATASSSQYASSLAYSQGEPNTLLLEQLATLARTAENHGGKLLLLLPPLLPGMEAALLRQPQMSAELMHTKERLGAWAKRENMVVLDAGQSERFGCTTSEFIDQHHAYSTCYDKIFMTFWNKYAPARNDSVAWPPGGLY